MLSYFGPCWDNFRKHGRRHDAIFIPQAPEHALFEEHTTAATVTVLLQPDRVCGTACHLTCDFLTLATTTSDAD